MRLHNSIIIIHIFILRFHWSFSFYIYVYVIWLNCRIHTDNIMNANSKNWSKLNVAMNVRANVPVCDCVLGEVGR